MLHGKVYSILCQSRVSHREQSVLKRHGSYVRGQSTYMQQHGLVLREDERLIELYGESNWRVKSFRTLHQHWFILLLAFLMVLDIVFMVVDLVLAAFYPECGTVLNSAVCEFNSSATLPSPSPEGVCTKGCAENPAAVENAKIGFTVASIIILTIFLLELHVHIAIVGLKRFFSDVFLALDWTIIMISLGLEIYLLISETALKNKSNEAAVEATTVPLIIIARSWRLLRIGHGAYKEAHDFYGEKIEQLEEEILSLRKKLHGQNELDSGTNKDVPKDDGYNSPKVFAKDNEGGSTEPVTGKIVVA